MQAFYVCFMKFCLALNKYKIINLDHMTDAGLSRSILRPAYYLSSGLLFLLILYNI